MFYLIYGAISGGAGGPTDDAGNHLWPHKASTRSPTLNAADVMGATREVVRQFGHAVSAPRLVGVVPLAPARRARHEA